MNVETDAWDVDVKSLNLRNLLGSFGIKIPKDPQKLSFAKQFLETSKLTELVAEIQCLARGVSLCKNLKYLEIKPGAVYIFEVVVWKEDHHEFIEGKVLCLLAYTFKNLSIDLFCHE